MTTSPTDDRRPSHAKAKKPLLSFNKRFLPFILGAVIAVIGIIILLVILFGGSPASTAVKDFWHTYYLHDTAKISTLAPVGVWSWIEDKTGIDQIELTAFLKEAGAEYREPLCTELGSDINISYNIVKEETVSGEELATLTAQLETDYAIPPSAVDAVRRLTVDVTLQGSEDTRIEDGEELIVFEIDGKQYVDKAFRYAYQMAKNAAAYYADQE